MFLVLNNDDDDDDDEDLENEDADEMGIFFSVSHETGEEQRVQQIHTDPVEYDNDNNNNNDNDNCSASASPTASP